MSNVENLPAVDVVVLHRPGQIPRDEVLQAIRRQTGVQICLHLHVGAAQPGDLNRWATIARARNGAKRSGNTPWLMFVDDDVVLADDCIVTLLAEVRVPSQLGALAADYDHDQKDPTRRGHVSMGATLFRRDRLNHFEFRSTSKWCECWCACWDLRRQGVEIRYSQTARATHLRTRAVPTVSPRILAAFDRRDIGRFEHQFLHTLRSHDNKERVIAVAYGLYPSEQTRLQRLDHVELVFQPFNGVMPPIRRLTDFAAITKQLDPTTPVAYWDVADVVFQDSLRDLWQAVLDHPDRLLAVKEPKGYPYNQVIPAWSLSIRDTQCRQIAFDLLKQNPFLNSGFAAGTAQTIGTYFQQASLMRQSPTLAGTTDWGDQMALNLYCHSRPGCWHATDQRWNYCVHDRPSNEVHVNPHGLIQSRSGVRISVAHGNARSLRQFSLTTIR